MRKDLNKLMCERERVHSSDKFRNFRKMKVFSHSRGEECEDLPLREGMKKRYKVRGDWKTFGENLNPLYGFIRKCVGKPWDDSFSELCTVFNMNSVINQHILQHLFQTVELHVIEEDGQIYHRTYKNELRPVEDYSGPEYYVHPRTGILIANNNRQTYRAQERERKARWQAEREKTVRVISETEELRFRDGVWFIVTISDVPATYMARRCRVVDGAPQIYVEPVHPSVFDMWERSRVSQDGYVMRSFIGLQPRIRAKKYVSKIRTASHKELKKYGII